MYAKLEQDKLIYASRNFNTGANLILNFNKNVDLMKKYGFKEVIDIQPEYNSNTHYLTINNYTENEDTIIINYKLNEIQEVDSAPSLEERVQELETLIQEQLLMIQELSVLARNNKNNNDERGA